MVLASVVWPGGPPCPKSAMHHLAGRWPLRGRVGWRRLPRGWGMSARSACWVRGGTRRAAVARARRSALLTDAGDGGVLTCGWKEH
jgi:hypothetical protein